MIPGGITCLVMLFRVNFAKQENNFWLFNPLVKLELSRMIAGLNVSIVVALTLIVIGLVTPCLMWFVVDVEQHTKRVFNQIDRTE